MKIQNDPRLWLDKADGQTTFGLYENQRFYAVQFLEGDEEIRVFMEMVSLYAAWCKVAYAQARQGIPLEPFPDQLRIAARTAIAQVKEETISGKPKKTKAHTDAAKG